MIKRYFGRLNYIPSSGLEVEEHILVPAADNV